MQATLTELIAKQSSVSPSFRAILNPFQMAFPGADFQALTQTEPNSILSQATYTDGREVR